VKSIAIFADVSNIYYCLRKKFGPERKLDYGKYLEYVKKLGEIHEAVAYGAQMGNEARGFIFCLEQLGFTAKYKTPKTYQNEGRIRRKADWDVGITIDMVNQADRVDIMVLGTADGDLAPAAEWVQARGVKVIVLASGISRELKNIATEWIEIPESMLETTETQQGGAVRVEGSMEGQLPVMDNASVTTGGSVTASSMAPGVSSAEPDTGGAEPDTGGAVQGDANE
jgi:uncharacterized LabA/DUF88 family protein